MFIHSIVCGSPAAQSSLKPGDRVLALNGRDDLEDMFDYQFEVADMTSVDYRVKHADGTEEQIRMTKDSDADPGIVFTSPVFTPIKTCNNACPFCFIDQQPAGLRESLYVKDDDWRLSYFNNTYITLTNLTDRDRQRIAMIRPGPLYVSVHSTLPEIRSRLLNNPKHAGHIMKELQWLAGLDIPFHCQVVLCPGINDGESLTRTLLDLSTLRPYALSVAVIPVGLTAYREHLPLLSPVDKQTAGDVICRVNHVNAMLKRAEHADVFIFLSDEFYYKASLPFPSYHDYGDFPQLDDGVGSAQLFINDFYALEPFLPDAIPLPKNVLVITGKLAAMALTPIVQRLNQIKGFYADLVSVESRFWGSAVDVAGLITGQDIYDALAGYELNRYAFAVIPNVMLKEDTDLFLDGMTVADLTCRLSLPFRVVNDPYSAQAFLDQLSFYDQGPSLSADIIL